MKKYAYILLCAILFASCMGEGSSLTSSGDNKGKEYNPTRRESSLTDEEREAAIANKKAETGLDPDVVLFQRNIKLTVLPPKAEDEITYNVQLKVAERLMQIASIGGIGASGESPCFAIAAMMTPVSKKSTGTVPQKCICTYNVTIFVGNMVDGMIYAGITQKVTGAGSSFEDAAVCAAGEIKNSNEMQQMLQSAEEQIISWYENNISTLKQQVNACVARADYSMAYALLSCVPAQAKKCYAYAVPEEKKVLRQLQNQKANELLFGLQDAIAKAGVHYNPDVAAHYQMIPDNSPQYKKAQSLYAQYVNGIKKAYQDSVNFEKHKFDEEIALKKLKLKYEYEAANKAAERAASGKNSLTGDDYSNNTASSSSGSQKSSKGFFRDNDGSINWSRVGWTAVGATVLGAAAVGSLAMSAAGAVLSHSLFLWIL